MARALEMITACARTSGSGDGPGTEGRATARSQELNFVIITREVILRDLARVGKVGQSVAGRPGRITVADWGAAGGSESECRGQGGLPVTVPAAAGPPRAAGPRGGA
jgi:hypothetical protein